MTAPRETIGFLGRAFNDYASTMTTVMAALGDRLGLFRTLASMGPTTAADLAAAAGVDARYTAEWAAAMATARYLEHDPDAGTFVLPDAHVPVLADESSPYALGGVLQSTLGLFAAIDAVTDAFRTGAGVPYERYTADVFDGMSRMTGAAHDNVLVPAWLPTIPQVEARLRDGCSVADVGCGHGRGLVAMAKAYPQSTYTGYDAFPPQVEAATQRAEAAGVGDRVTFEVVDAIDGLPRHHDVIFAFDVLHDAKDPLALLKAIRAALTDGGGLVLVEPNSGATIEDNAGPLGTVLYGMSVMYCLSVSLGVGGPGLGTCGTPEPTIRSLCEQAGFTAVEEAPIDNLFNRMWVAS